MYIIFMTSVQYLHFKITIGFMFKDYVYSIILLNKHSRKKEPCNIYNIFEIKTNLYLIKINGL